MINLTIVSAFEVFAVLLVARFGCVNSEGGSVHQNVECGMQDMDEVYDMHAAAPWAGALFYFDGDVFQNQISLRYLGTSIFLSKTLAIASGSSILAERSLELQTNVQIYYGHRGSGRQSLNRVRKVEPLIPPKQPFSLPYRVPSSSSRNRISNGGGGVNNANITRHAELYLLHLEAPIEVSSYSRPLCVNKDIFRGKAQYYGITGSTKIVHLSGYAARNDSSSQGPHVVYFSGDKDWRVHSWDMEYIVLSMRDRRVTYDFLPRNFDPGSAITVKQNGRFYLAGIVLPSKTSNQARTVARSIEKFADTIIAKVSARTQEEQLAMAPSKLQQQPQLEILTSTTMTTSTTVLPSPFEHSVESISWGDVQSGPGLSKIAQQDYFKEVEKLEEVPVPETIVRSPPTTAQSRPVTCYQENLEGVDIECLSRPRGVSVDDCIKNAPPNSKIRLSCKPFYVPIEGRLMEKTCDSSGTWLPRRTFGCRLDCGNFRRPNGPVTIPFVVHGSKTQSEQWPWHAALFKKVNETSYTYICGATLITRSMLISAAHCVYSNHDSYDTGEPDQYKVVVGAISSQLHLNRKDNQTEEFVVRKIRVSEHYSTRTFESDIALLQLDKPVFLTEFVRPVCFPFPSEENKLTSIRQLSEGNRGIVVGFGTTETWRISENLRMAELPVVSATQCFNVLDRKPSSTQYCAGYTNGTSVCEGDSGGGHFFMDPNSKRYFIQGIISHGNRKETAFGDVRCDHEKYSVFTKVQAFSEWVDKVVNELEYDYNR